MNRLFRFVSLLLLIGIVSPVQSQSPLKFRDENLPNPQTFAFIVGISKYEFVRPLTYADKDAQLFKNFLQSPGGGNVKDENIFMLLNEEATNQNFWVKGFQWLRAKQLQKGDRLFIYLAGHGDAIDEDQFFFLGYNCNPQGDKNNYLVSGAIQLFNLKKKISNETAKGVDVYFIMDACRSNELPGGAEGQGFLNTAVSEKKAGEIIMLATGAGQESLEDKSIGNGHGLFTYYLVDGLSGVADNEGTPDYKVTYNEIRNYVDTKVPSVAQQRFSRSQNPYFCCNENSGKVISTVDPTYLQEWLKEKSKLPGGGNAFHGPYSNRFFNLADTSLQKTYNDFYKAIKKNNITGKNSAEDFYQQLADKFPGSPFTLDAKSTLSVKYIDYAQAKVDKYLSCVQDNSLQTKQTNSEAASRLEKAIQYVKDIDADFANSLMGRLFLLKASGINASPEAAFQNAYSALAIDPNGAYIENELALLHLENNQQDSALYYANRAVKTAPKWECALSTLALIQKAVNNKKPNNNKGQKHLPTKKVRFGFTIGGGINQTNPTYSGNANSSYSDVRSNTNGEFGVGLIAQIALGNTIYIRPTVNVQFENSKLDYIRSSGPGEPDFVNTTIIKNTTANLHIPLVISFSTNNVAPYIMLGPNFSVNVGQNQGTGDVLSLKKTFFGGDAGLGVDIGLGKSGFVISPELKINTRLSDIHEPNPPTPNAMALSSLKKTGFTFNLYFRRR